MSRRTRLTLIAGLVIAITFLQYFTKVNAYRHHIIYDNLYFVPIILAGFWFGLRAAVSVSLIVVLTYVPFLFLAWGRKFSGYDLNYLMDLVLYVVAAALIGYLRESDWAEERRAREAERLAAMGKALSALAHDLKTPLIAIGGFSRCVQKRMAPEDPLREKMEVIAEESGRLENMMADILDFARPLKLERTQGDIRETIARTLSIAEPNAIKRGVSLRMHSKQLPLFPFDRCRLEEALLNLVNNAIEASPEGEAVWVEAYLHHSHLAVEVTDRGSGIPPDIREQIFEPFLTTKRGGTGLGLPTARKIIESHGGHIEIFFNGKGTTCRVTIPII